MRIVITGGAGFIGKKLARALLARGTLIGSARHRAVDPEITLFDVVAADGLPDDPRLARRSPATSPIRRPCSRSIRDGVDGVFHLAAIVSANAEEDFDLGIPGQSGRYAQRPRGLPRAARAATPGVRELGRGLWRRHARGPGRRHHPDAADLLRRAEGGGRAAAQRLQPQGLRRRPCAAPADHRGPARQAQRAASTFASSIIREPLAGAEAICPVGRDARDVHPLAAPGDPGPDPRLRAAGRGASA